MGHRRDKRSNPSDYWDSVTQLQRARAGAEGQVTPETIVRLEQYAVEAWMTQGRPNCRNISRCALNDMMTRSATMVEQMLDAQAYEAAD